MRNIPISAFLSLAIPFPYLAFGIPHDSASSDVFPGVVESTASVPDATSADKVDSPFTDKAIEQSGLPGRCSVGLDVDQHGKVVGGHCDGVGRLALQTDQVQRQPTAIVYEILHATADEPWLRRFALERAQQVESLSVERSSMSTDSLGVDLSLTHARTIRSVRVSNRSRKTPSTVVPPDAAQHSESRAADFLRSNRLWPNGDLRLVSANSASVDYSRVLDAKDGGGRISVRLRPDGSVDSATISWPSLRPWKRFRIVEPDTAVQRFKDGAGVFIWDNERVTITGMRLAYCDLGMVDPSRYLVPCYKLLGTRRRADSSHTVGSSAPVLVATVDALLDENLSELPHSRQRPVLTK